MKSEVRITGKRLQITRIFDAPRALVFSYWKQPDKLEQWSGCKDATSCKIEMDFRAGGSFTQKMHIAGAGEFCITGQYDEIFEPERIVYHAQLGPATVKVAVEFIERGSQTKVVMTHDGFPDEFLCTTVSRGTSEGLEKLESILSSQMGTGQAASA
jgi:uncharacterized protein YndB with AHSA1/START domain